MCYGMLVIILLYLRRGRLEKKVGKGGLEELEAFFLSLEECAFNAC